MAESWANGRTIAAVRVVLAQRDTGPDGRLVCPLCDREIGSGQAVDIDHAVGRAAGGSGGLANLRLTHARCNRGARAAAQRRASRVGRTLTPRRGRWQSLAETVLT